MDNVSLNKTFYYQMQTLAIDVSVIQLKLRTSFSDEIENKKH